MNTTLTAVHAAIIEKLKTQFSHKVPTIRVHSPLITEVQAPALLLALDHMTEVNGQGDGRTTIKCSFSAAAVLPVADLPPEQITVAAVNYAAELVDFIRYNQWGLGSDVQRPQNLSAQPADFKPDHSGYESWVVTWEQAVTLGDAEEETVITPSTVYLSESPNTGTKYEDDYEQLV